MDMEYDGEKMSILVGKIREHYLNDNSAFLEEIKQLFMSHSTCTQVKYQSESGCTLFRRLKEVDEATLEIILPFLPYLHHGHQEAALCYLNGLPDVVNLLRLLGQFCLDEKAGYHVRNWVLKGVVSNYSVYKTHHDEYASFICCVLSGLTDPELLKTVPDILVGIFDNKHVLAGNTSLERTLIEDYGKDLSLWNDFAFLKVLAKGAEKEIFFKDLRTWDIKVLEKLKKYFSLALEMSDESELKLLLLPLFTLFTTKSSILDALAAHGTEGLFDAFCARCRKFASINNLDRKKLININQNRMQEIEGFLEELKGLGHSR